MYKGFVSNKVTMEDKAEIYRLNTIESMSTRTISKHLKEHYDYKLSFQRIHTIVKQFDNGYVPSFEKHYKKKTVEDKIKIVNEVNDKIIEKYENNNKQIVQNTSLYNTIESLNDYHEISKKGRTRMKELIDNHLTDKKGGLQVKLNEVSQAAKVADDMFFKLKAVELKEREVKVRENQLKLDQEKFEFEKQNKASADEEDIDETYDDNFDNAMLEAVKGTDFNDITGVIEQASFEGDGDV